MMVLANDFTQSSSLENLLDVGNKELLIYRRFLAICASASFHLSGVETAEFSEELWCEARRIGRMVNRIGGKSKMQLVYSSLSKEEKEYVGIVWKGIGGWK